MKHVERRHFYVRELVEENRLRCTFVSTVDNLADFFTKDLKASVFFPMRDKIMNVARSDAQSSRSSSRTRVSEGDSATGGC